MLVLAGPRERFPRLGRPFADGGCQGRKSGDGAAALRERPTIDVVGRPDAAGGFAALPEPWAVERTFARPDRRRGLAEDGESPTRTALAFLEPASIRLMPRRTCDPP